MARLVGWRIKSTDCSEEVLDAKVRHLILVDATWRFARALVAGCLSIYVDDGEHAPRLFQRITAIVQ